MTLFAFHKPFGVLCQFRDPERPTLADYIDIPNIYPAGRLDANSEGLLLLTDQGAEQARISHPQFHTEKTYQVQLENIPEPGFSARLRKGCNLRDGAISALRARRLSAATLAHGPHPGRLPEHRDRNSAWFELTLDSGRNRIVRRFCAALGHPVLRLIRTSVGSIELNGLGAGQLREETWSD